MALRPGSWHVHPRVASTAGGRPAHLHQALQAQGAAHFHEVLQVLVGEDSRDEEHRVSAAAARFEQLVGLRGGTGNVRCTGDVSWGATHSGHWACGHSRSCVSETAGWPASLGPGEGYSCTASGKRYGHWACICSCTP